jgi:2'-hydroxyisoflavone reductase
MKLLILGGTKFVGRHITQSAVDAGHRVTLFNRGQSNRDLFPQVEKLIGDRDRDLKVLRGKKWDAVIEVNGYLPRIVKAGAELLRDQVDYYLFISTVSVYAETKEPLTENSPLVELQDPNTELSGETYGGLKVWCERYVNDVYGERAAIVRPAFVIGPHDHTDRFPYWLWRASRGGQMVVPGGDEITAAIDGRDLANFVLHLVETNKPGVYNAQGPVNLLDSIRLATEISAADTQFIPVSVEFAEKNEALGLIGGKLPMWIAGAENVGFRAATNEEARQAGLRLRPLRDTVRDTFAWIQERESAGHEWKAGLSEQDETSLLEQLTVQA